MPVLPELGLVRSDDLDEVLAAVDYGHAPYAGGTELVPAMGQGSRTALAQIAARELRVPLESVAVGQSDTRYTPFEWTTGARPTTTVVGLAVQAACDDLWRSLRSKAAESVGLSIDHIEVRDGLIHTAADSSGANEVGPGVGSGVGGAGVGAGSGAGSSAGSGAGAAAGAGGGSAAAACSARTAAEVIREWFGAGAGEVIGVGVIRREGTTALLPPFWEIGAVGVEVAVDEATARSRSSIWSRSATSATP